jgi:carnitine 3-dehydrogenase
MEVPELTDAFLDKLETQSDAQAGGLPVGELERRRDDGLVAVLQALRAEDLAAGRLLNEHEARLYDAHAASALADADPARPLPLVDAIVRPDWLDYNGHMTESRYLEVFANATDAFLRLIGLDQAYVAGGHSVYTVETHLRHLAEVEGFAPLHVAAQVLGADAKRVHLFHTMTHRDTGAVLATAEHMLLHVDAHAGSACPFGEPLATRVAEIAAAQSGLPRPEAAGRAVSLAR